MTSFRETLEMLESSKTFKDWHKDNKKSYLSFGFIMKDPAVKEEWQIGYYLPDSDMITSFAVSDEITQNPASEVYKEKGKVKELDISKVTVKFEKAMDEAEKLQKKEYSAHPAIKKLAILQNLDIGQVWNITFMTRSFKTLNIKVDAASGKVLKHEIVELFKMDA